MQTNRNPAAWSVIRVLLLPVRVVLVVLCIALVLISVVPAAILSIPHMLKVPHAPPLWGIPMKFGMWTLIAQQVGLPHAELQPDGIKIRIWPFGAVRRILWAEIAAIRKHFAVYVPPLTIVLSSGQELDVRVFQDVPFDAAASERGVLQNDG